jgi:hypothetical protein
MALVGSKRYIEFRIADTDGNAITNRDLAATTVGQRVLVSLFRDTVACADVVTLTNWSSGRYYASYTPSASGHDYLEIYDELYDLRFIDAEDIEASSIVEDLTQDLGGSGKYKVVDANPARFTLLVYRSFDWQSGRTDSSYSLAATRIDASGNWVDSPLSVLPDTYHLVLTDSSSGEIRIIATFLKVGS